MKGSTVKEHNGDPTSTFSEMADSALKNYEQAVRTGLKLQEEAGKWWTSMFNQTAFGQDWQKQWTNLSGMANSLLPLTQRRVEEVMGLMEKNSRQGAELVKKAVDAAQSPALAERQTKWMEFWTASMGVVRSNTEAVSEISTKAIDGWIDFVQRNADVTEARTPKAAA